MPYKKRHHMSKVARSKTHWLPENADAQGEQCCAQRGFWQGRGTRSSGELALQCEPLALTQQAARLFLGKAFSRHVAIRCVRQAKDVFWEAAVPFFTPSCYVD